MRQRLISLFSGALKPEGFCDPRASRALERRDNGKMVTVSDFEGRLRIRDKQLRNPVVVEALREALAESPEVYQSLANVKAGSLLVLYRHSSGIREWIMSRIGSRLQSDRGESAHPGGSAQSVSASRRARAVSRRKLVHSGMLASLALSLLGAALDWKKLHLVSGILFIGVVGLHVSGKRRQLFT